MRYACIALAARLLGLLLCATTCLAEVKLEVRADGSVFLYNDAPRRARPARRTAPTDLGEWIETSADRHRLDPDLVRAVIQVESVYRPEAVSHKGAMGLMQLMPATARDFSVDDPFDPYENVVAGTAYLRSLLDRFDGRVELALAGYNAGPEAVQRHGGIPPYPETRTYVERVLRIYQRQPGFTLAAAGDLRMGRPTYLSRDRAGRLVLTTSPTRAD